METALLTVLVLKDFSITIEGTTHSGKKGETMELPLWIGKALEEVEFVGLKTTEVKRLLFEEGSPNLTKFPQNFYDATRVTQKDDKEFRKVFMQLLNRRVEKIALSAAYSSVDKNICHEEKVLFVRLASVIEQWKAQIMKDVGSEYDEV